MRQRRLKSLFGTDQEKSKPCENGNCDTQIATQDQFIDPNCPQAPVLVSRRRQLAVLDLPPFAWNFACSWAWAWRSNCRQKLARLGRGQGYLAAAASDALQTCSSDLASLKTCSSNLASLESLETCSGPRLQTLQVTLPLRELPPPPPKAGEMLAHGIRRNSGPRPPKAGQQTCARLMQGGHIIRVGQRYSWRKGA